MRPDQTPLLTDFTISIDSREQCPWSFTGFKTDAKQGNRPLIVPTQVTTLATGDYSIVGFEALLSIERKSIQDFYSTVLGSRDRFERELSRLQTMAESGGYVEIVCEGDWYTEGPPLRPGESMDDPKIKHKLKTVYRSVLAWKQKFNRVHWERFPGRRDAERYVFRTLERFWKVKQVDANKTSAVGT